MRARRHTSGNSNANAPQPRPRPASARGDAAAPVELRRATFSGAATARRPDAPEKETVAGSKRRIHSARVERSTSQDAPPASLPRLVNSPGIGGSIGAAGSVQWALKVAEPCEEAPAAIPAHVKPVLRDFSALLRDRYDGKRSLRIAFLNWDRDKDGQLSVQEIREMIQTLGLAKKLGRESVDALLGYVDRLPSHSLRYDDFCKYVYEAHSSESQGPGEKPPPSAAVAIAPAVNVEPPKVEDEVVLSSDRALYPDVEHVVNILRKKYDARPLRQVFRHWDADKDGHISLEELDMNLRRQGVKLPKQQLRELFERHDVDQDGRLLYKEFVRLIYGPVTVEHHNAALQARLHEVSRHDNQPTDPYRILRNSALENPVRRIDEDAICAAVQEKIKAFAPRIHDAYTAFDDDHNGNLSYAEFRQGLDELGLHFTEREFLHLAAVVDTDGSGEISFREFSNMFHRRTTSEARAKAQTVANDPELIAKQRARLSHGTFDFSHLARRTKAPTRHGRTPYGNTADIISPTSGEFKQHGGRFRTETSLYGSGQRPPPPAHTRPRTAAMQGDSNEPPQLTLGREDKQRKDAQYAARLERIRQSQQQYESSTEPRKSDYDVNQQRRTETLLRHQQRYQSSIEEQRPPPQAPYSPKRMSRARQPTQPPFINGG